MLRILEFCSTENACSTALSFSDKNDSLGFDNFMSSCSAIKTSQSISCCVVAEPKNFTTLYRPLVLLIV